MNLLNEIILKISKLEIMLRSSKKKPPTVEKIHSPLIQASGANWDVFHWMREVGVCLGGRGMIGGKLGCYSLDRGGQSLSWR